MTIETENGTIMVAGKDWSDGPLTDAECRQIVEHIVVTRAIVADRARFERLREFTDAAIEWERANVTGMLNPEWQAQTRDRVKRARAALQLSDLDPLP